MSKDAGRDKRVLNASRRDALKLIGCSGCAFLASSCTFSELYDDFEGEVVQVSLADQEFTALKEVGGMSPIDVGPFKLNLIRISESEVIAIDRICPHLQEDMAPIGSSDVARGVFSNGTLICSAHGSQFDVMGAVVGGPSPSPLQTFPCVLETNGDNTTVTAYIGVEPPGN